MPKIGVVGYFGFSTDNPIIGGQMAKTLGIYDQLCKNHGEENVQIVDTSNWKAEKVKLVSQCWRVACSCKKIIIMPNKHGIKFVLPFFATLKNVFHYQLAYPVVGGWLTSLLENHRYLKKSIKKIDYILPETEELKLELGGFYSGNIDVMSIFSIRTPISVDEVNYDIEPPYKFCTFSRVTQEKGIDDAIEAISRVNDSSTKIKCTLDVWGPIENGKEEHYNTLFHKHQAYVTYKGVLNGEDCLKVLSQYFCMLFPSFYPGEGFPTSVCESYMSGLPVIASDWRFNKEIVKNDETGYLFHVKDMEALSRCIEDAITEPRKILAMKKICLEYSENFKPENVIKPLTRWLCDA